MSTDPGIARQITNESRPAADPPSRRLALFGFVGLLVVFLASVWFTLPQRDYFTICGFKYFTGLPCPGCGLTHSFCAFGKGDIADAFAFNLLGPPLFLALIFLWIRSGFILLRRTVVVQYLDRMTARYNIVRAFAIGFVLYGIARIAYLIAYNPITFQNSPLSHLIGRITP